MDVINPSPRERLECLNAGRDGFVIAYFDEHDVPGMVVGPFDDLALARRWTIEHAEGIWVDHGSFDRWEVRQ